MSAKVKKIKFVGGDGQHTLQVSIPGALVLIHTHVPGLDSRDRNAVEIWADGEFNYGKQWWITDGWTEGENPEIDPKTLKVTKVVTVEQYNRPDKTVEKPATPYHKRRVVRVDVDHMRPSHTVTIFRTPGETVTENNPMRHGTVPCGYSPTPSSTKRLQRAMRSAGGVRRYSYDDWAYTDTSVYRYIEWYRNGSRDAHPCNQFTMGPLLMTVLPDLRLKLQLSAGGQEIVDEYKENEDIDFAMLEVDLLEYAVCNGMSLDPDDDGRTFITFASLDDDGQLDVKPGDFGWYYNAYAVRSWAQSLVEYGSVVFSVYYFGESSLDQQRTIGY